MKYLKVEAFSNWSNTIPLIDVRSPKEYTRGHISGAVNIPLFSDNERHEVGTIYKKIGRLSAIEKGLEFTAPKMIEMAQKARQLDTQLQRRVYCWRGGMRSEKMAWLFELVGLQCEVLQGGYKAYRSKLLNDFHNISRLIVLHGSTGCGKTEILKCLQNMGEQIIDLEELASHKGSAFGHIDMAEQPTTQQFQNDIHKTLQHLNLQKPIWIEAESLKIGSVNLPDTLWEKMKRSTVVEIKVDRHKRIERLINEYGSYNPDRLRDSILKIKEQLGGKKTNMAIEYLQHNKLFDTVDLILDYYDRTYEFTRQKFRDRSMFTIESVTGDPLVNAKTIFDNYYKHHAQYEYTN